MSVSQANGSTPYASRRRRRGGRGGGSGSNNRGDTRPALWQEGNSRARAVAGSSDRGDSGDGGKQQSGGAPLNAPSRGKGKANGGGMGGRQGKGSPPDEEEEESVHPAMLESEFLASTDQADADASGVASLSLEEVPYDRDLRWCNMSSSSRPRPTMDTSSGVFGRVGASITQDTGDYERLDRHYQELWKDREGNGPPPPPRGRGNRAGQGVRTRGRGSNGGGNGGGPQRSSTPNGPGREDITRHGTLSKRNRGGGGGRTGGRGGRGAGNRSSAEKGGESATGGRGGGQRGVASSLHLNGGGGGGEGASTVAQRRGQRGGGSSMGRSGGRGGAVAASKGVAHSSTGASSRNPQPVMAPAFRGQEAAVVAAATTRVTTQAHVASVPSWQGRVGGGSPARAASNGRHGWEGTDQRPLQPPSNQHQHHPLTPVFGPWVMEPGQSRSPVGPTGFARAPDGGAVVMRTPPLIPAMPPMIGGPRPDSPEYLGDIANALSAAPFVERTSEEPSKSMDLADQPMMRQQQQQQQQHSLTVSMSSPLGPELLGGSTVDDRNGFGGGEGGVGGGGGGGITAAQNGGAALSPYLSPRRTKTSPDIRSMANPSLEFDIQDICADPDLNVNAPAFVPGGYLST